MMFGKTPPDVVRVHLNSLMIKNGIFILSPDYIRFYNFLKLNESQPLLSKFIELGIGILTRKHAAKILMSILDEYYETKEIIPYEELFKTNSDWYEFYSDNAFPDGRLKKRENRKGVRRSFAEDVNKIYILIRVDLVQAIKVCNIINLKSKIIKLNMISEEDEFDELFDFNNNVFC